MQQSFRNNMTEHKKKVKLISKLIGNWDNSVQINNRNDTHSGKLLAI